MSHIKIEMITAIRPGIDGAKEGAYHIDYTWKNASPATLVLAVKHIAAARQRLTQAYGNIGHAGIWLEVNRLRIGKIEEQRILNPDESERNSNEAARRVLQDLRVIK